MFRELLIMVRKKLNTSISNRLLRQAVSNYLNDGIWIKTKDILNTQNESFVHIMFVSSNEIVVTKLKSIGEIESVESYVILGSERPEPMQSKIILPT